MQDTTKEDAEPSPNNEADGNGRRQMHQDIPDHVDHTTTGMTTPVKSQGGCGGCWALAATTVVESALLLSGALVTNSTLELSTQEILDCDTAFFSRGCSGGR